jgi:hypothetical protein
MPPPDAIFHARSQNVRDGQWSVVGGGRPVDGQAKTRPDDGTAPPDFVQRLVEFDALKRKLLDAKGDASESWPKVRSLATATTDAASCPPHQGARSAAAAAGPAGELISKARCRK